MFRMEVVQRKMGNVQRRTLLACSRMVNVGIFVTQITRKSVMTLVTDNQCGQTFIGFHVKCLSYLPDFSKTDQYTGCHRRNGPNFGRVFLMLNYTDITQNTYIRSWTVTEIMAIEKCGLLWCPHTVSRPWRRIYPLRKPGNDKLLANIGMQWRWRDNSQLLPASVTWKPKANATVVRVFL